MINPPVQTTTLLLNLIAKALANDPTIENIKFRCGNPRRIQDGLLEQASTNLVQREVGRKGHFFKCVPHIYVFVCVSAVEELQSGFLCFIQILCGL